MTAIVEAWWRLPLLGLAAGELSAFFGIGGGWVVTPALDIFGWPIAQAIGSGIAFIFGTSLLGIYRHSGHGRVEWRLGVALGAPMAAGVEVGKRLLLTLDRAGNAALVVRLLYVGLLSGLGLAMFIEAARARTHCAEPSTTGHRLLTALRWPPRVHLNNAAASFSLWPLVGVGVVTGLLAGLLGVGGGFLLVPLLIYGVGLPTVTAVATSLLAVALGACYGCAAYGLGGHVDWPAVGFMLLGTLIGVPLGVFAAGRMPAARLRLLYALMLLLGAGAVLLKLLGHPLAAATLILGSAVGMAVWILVRTVRPRATLPPPESPPPRP